MAGKPIDVSIDIEPGDIPYSKKVFIETKSAIRFELENKDGNIFNLLGSVRCNGIADFLERRKEIKSSRLLDFGCATGGPSIAFLKKGADVIALDVDPILIELTSISEEFIKVV